MNAKLQKHIYKGRIIKALSGGRTRTVHRISNWTRMPDSNDTYPRHREYIRELIDEGYLIGSSKDGYKMMTSAKEVQVYLNSLLKRQLGMSKRIQAVYDAAQNQGIL